MSRYVISPAAERDIESILIWTHEHFGEQGRLRYEALLVQALSDVVAGKNHAGSHQREEIAVAARISHLHHSRKHVPLEVGRVERPRHFLLYRIRSDGALEIGRVLHDSMDLERHLPDEYCATAGQ